MTKDKVEQGKAGHLFEDFLKEQGSYEETTEIAVNRVLAFQYKAAFVDYRKVAMRRSSNSRIKR